MNVAGGIVLNVSADETFGDGGVILFQVVNFTAFAALHATARFDVASVLSVSFQPGNSSNSPVTVEHLQHPVVFQLPVNITRTSLLTCDTQTPPQCAFFQQTVWNQSGCTTSFVNGSTMECRCDRLADFSILPSAHYTQPRTASDYTIAISALAVLIVVFFFAIGYGVRFDKRDRGDPNLRRDKEQKWARSLATQVNARRKRCLLLRAFYSELKKKHTYLAFYFRKKGLSFRMVDRACTNFIVILTVMSVCSSILSPKAVVLESSDVWVGMHVVVARAVAVSLIPYLIMETVFTKIGRIGYKDDFDLESGLRVNVCCPSLASRRLPFWVSYVMYFLVCVVGISLVVYVGVQAPALNTNPHLCENGSNTWLNAVIFAVLAHIFLAQPVKIFLCTLWWQFAVGELSLTKRKRHPEL